MSWVCYFLKGRKFFNGNLLIVKYCDKQGSKYIYIVIKVKNFLFRFKLRCACGVFIAIFLVHNSKRPMVYKGIRYFARLQDFLKKSYSIFLKKRIFFSPQNRRDHEEICPYKPVQCPEFDCSETRPMNEIFKHFRLEHHHHFVNAHGNIFNGDIRCDDSNMIMGIGK